jgi:RNA polymerase sigma-70 factor (ECF subfamily)
VILGDDRGFETFFAHEYRAVVALAFVLCGRLDGAEDLAQEAFAAAYRDWSRVGSYDDPGAWIRRVVANRAVSLRRRRSSEARVLTRLLARRALSEPEVPFADPAMWSAIRSLPRRQVQVIALVYVEDRSLAQAAAILGCGEETAKTHLRRAKASLAKRLGIDRSEESP